MMGGMDGAFRPLSTNLCYSIKNDTWEEKAPLSIKRGGAISTVYEDKIYLFGGKQNREYSLNTECYNTLTNTWTTMSNAWETTYSAGALIGNNFYITGGDTKDGKVNLHKCYNLITNTWTTKSNMEYSSYSHGCKASGNGFFVFGGSTKTDEAGVSSATKYYNISTNTWTTKSNMPIANYGFGSAILGDGNIYCFGGLRGKKTFYKYDTTLNEWSLIGELPSQMMEVSTVEYHDKIFVIRGYDENYNSFDNILCFE